MTPLKSRAQAFSFRFATTDGCASTAATSDLKTTAARTCYTKIGCGAEPTEEQVGRIKAAIADTRQRALDAIPDAPRASVSHTAAIRYNGQAHHLDVAIDSSVSATALSMLIERFEADYEALFGKGAGFREAGVELLSVRAVATQNANVEATCDPAVYSRINSLVRESCDIVLNNSTGGGVHGDMLRPLGDAGLMELNWDERIKGMDGVGAEMCTLDAHTVCASFGGNEILVTTTPSRCRYLAIEFQKRGIKPEWECFSLAHIIQDVAQLIAEGFDKPPYFFNLVLGAHRAFQGGLPYTPKILQTMVEHLPEGAMFCVSGIGPAQLPATTHALLLGGHVRVGLEDNLMYAQGQPATNVQLVERMVRIIRELGYETATAAEARDIMGLAPLAAAG